MMQQTQAAVILFFAFTTCLHAWGPVTHLYLCFLAEETNSSGCNSPDALKVDWPELHSLEFAADLFWHAYNSTNDDLIEFALGFGCHVASDEVGHHIGGFLNPPSADHEIEFNLDSMIFHERSGASFDATAEYLLTEQEVDLILNAAAQYTSLTSATHRNLRNELSKPNAIDRARIHLAIDNFKLMTSTERALIKLQPSSMYKFELQRHSFCKNVSNFQDVVANFNVSAKWAVSTCRLWKKTLLTRIKNGNIDDAAPIMHRAVNELFRSNNGTSCSKLL